MRSIFRSAIAQLLIVFVVAEQVTAQSLWGGLVRLIEREIYRSAPLRLEQTSAFRDAGNLKDFNPTFLTPTSVEDLTRPLPPGDYSLAVTAYCARWSIHAPGQGIPYKLAPLKGTQAKSISALLARGTIQNVPPATLQALSWNIQTGLLISQWSGPQQSLAHELIPDFEKELQGDWLERIESIYKNGSRVGSLFTQRQLPSFETIISQLGEPGQLFLEARRARKILRDRTVAAERLPDLLYERQPGDYLPRDLQPSATPQESPWAEIRPGVFARFIIQRGNLRENLFEFRITAVTARDAIPIPWPWPGWPSIGGVLGGIGGFIIANPGVPIAAAGALLIAYAISRPAQALIIAPAKRPVQPGKPDPQDDVPVLPAPTQTDDTKVCPPGLRSVVFSYSRVPEITAHIQEAQAEHPEWFILTKSSEKKLRRKRKLRGM